MNTKSDDDHKERNEDSNCIRTVKHEFGHLLLVVQVTYDRWETAKTEALCQ